VEAEVHTSQLLLVATRPATIDSSLILTEDTRLAVGSLSTTDRTSTEGTANTMIATVGTTISDEVLLLLTTSVSLTEVIADTEKALPHETMVVEIGDITSMAINVLALLLGLISGITAAKTERLCIQRNMPRNAILLFKILTFYTRVCFNPSSTCAFKLIFQARTVP